MVVRTKIVAIILGPFGVGLFSLIQNVSVLFLSILPIGAVGLTKYTAEYFELKKYSQINYLIKVIILHNFPLLLLISTILVIFSKDFSLFLLSDNSYWYLMVIFAICLPFGMFSNILDIYLKSIRFISVYSKITILNAILSLIIFIPLVIYFGIAGAILGTGLSFISNILLCLFYMKKNNVLIRLKDLITVDKSVIKIIYSMGMAVLVMVVVQQVSFLVTRTMIANSLGVDKLGIYQSVFSISNNLFSLFYSTMAAYCIPKLSSFKDKELVIDEINRVLKFLLFSYTPLIILCFVFRSVLIAFLYSDQFSVAQELFIYQLLGDFFKSITWVIGLWFIPLGLKLKHWFIFEIWNSILYLSLSYVFLNLKLFDLKAVPVAYMISYILFLVLHIYFIKKSIKFEFRFRSLYILMNSLLVIVSIFLISEFSQLYGYILILPIILIWMILTVKKNDFTQFISVLKELANIKITKG